MNWKKLDLKKLKLEETGRGKKGNWKELKGKIWKWKKTRTEKKRNWRERNSGGKELEVEGTRRAEKKK